MMKALQSLRWSYIFTVVSLLASSVCSEEIAQDLEEFWQQQAKTSRFVGKGEITIAYVKVVHPNPKGVVVLVGGRTESYLKYQALIYAFYQRGYSLYSADHRGQGLSQRLLEDPLKGHVVNFSDYVEDLQQFLVAVVMPEAGKGLYMVAHSLGGAVGILTLEKNPDLFKAAILSAPMLEANLGLPAACGIVSFVNVFCNQCSTPRNDYKNINEAFADNNVTHSRDRYQASQMLFKSKPALALSAPTFGWVNQACAIQPDLKRAADNIRTPILLLQAGEDTVVHNRAEDEFCAVKKPTAESVCEGGKPVVIGGAFHEMFFETDQYRTPAIKQMMAMLERYP